MLGRLLARHGGWPRDAALKYSASALLLGVAWLQRAEALEPPPPREQPTALTGGSAATATIHWQRLPLRDAVHRLKEVFGANVFIDRRVDPTQRVSLDLEASRAVDVLSPLAAPLGLEVGRLGELLYLGPRQAAERLRPLAERRLDEVRQLPATQRSALLRRRATRWPRLTEPRTLVVGLVEQRGWRVEQAQQIPHDLWPAGDLPELSLAEQLTVLLLGFDLTFALRPQERAVVIAPLHAEALEHLAASAKRADQRSPARLPRARTAPETRQVYTLRVSEQPVRAVLHELSRRLNWQIEIDEAAIRAAGHSLDRRVSFAVESVDQDELLNALLNPAGLEFIRDGDRIEIVPRTDPD